MKIIVLNVSLTLLVGCAPPHQLAEVRQEAAMFHSRAELIKAEAEQDLVQLVFLRNNINVQGRSLTSQEIETVAEIDRLEQAFKTWESEIASTTQNGNMRKNSARMLGYEKARFQRIQDIQERMRRLLFQKINE